MAATVVAALKGLWQRGVPGRGARSLSLQPKPGPWPPGLEYIPKKKAKNPMMAVGLAWAIGFPCGILLFVLTKREVDKNRAKQMKALHNMRTANRGDYERQRFKSSAPETLAAGAGARP